MPIKHAIWKVGAQPLPLPTTTLLNEQQLEDMIVRAHGQADSQMVAIRLQ